MSFVCCVCAHMSCQNVISIQFIWFFAAPCTQLKPIILFVCVNVVYVRAAHCPVDQWMLTMDAAVKLYLVHCHHFVCLFIRPSCPYNLAHEHFVIASICSLVSTSVGPMKYIFEEQKPISLLWRVCFFDRLFFSSDFSWHLCYCSPFTVLMSHAVCHCGSKRNKIYLFNFFFSVG